MSQVTPTTVVDARKTIRFTVTKADIEKSARKDSSKCVLAVAVKREFHADAVQIHMSRAYVKIGDRWTRYLIDARSARELVSFDRGASFEPGEYTLRMPQPSQKLGATRSRSKSTGNGKKRTPAVHLKTKNVRKEMTGGVSIYSELT
jgi:hypothetical protein